MKRSALRFASEDELLLALTTGWLPDDVVAAPAFVAKGDERDERDELLVAPSVPLAKAVRDRLAKRGVGTSTLDGGTPIGSWAEGIAVRRAPEAGLDAGSIVFLLPRTDMLAALATELLRLGCDRQETRIVGERVLLRAVAPPFHVVARALDRDGGLRAFRPAGGAGVLVELGHAHPLADRLHPAEDAILLVFGHGDPWEILPDGPYADLLPHMELALPTAPARLAVTGELPRIVVPLSLARAARRTDPSLWVVARDAALQVERFVRGTPDEIVARYLFAVTHETPPRVLLRAKPGERGATEPAVDAEALAEHPQIPNLYLPADRTLEPPLRHGLLRALLAPDPSRVVFLGRETLTVESVPDDAFRPLDAYVDYLVDRTAAELATWIESATFDFARFTVDDAAASAPRAREAATPRKTRSERDDDVPTAPAPTPARPRRRAAEPVVAASVEAVPRAISETAAELAAAEADFLAATTPADDPSRTAAWARIGDLNATLARPREAAHAFTHAIWETRGEASRSLARRWALAEARVELHTILGKAATSPDEVRAVIAQVVALPEDAPLDVSSLVRFLDRHDAAIDVRSMWLARARGAQRAGDALMLARARDRALARLSRGLSVERDVPSFVRFLGRGSQTADLLAAELDALVARVLETKRARSPVEASPALTGAYAELTVAHGLARLGASDRARALAHRAAARLDASDAVHGYLSRAYGTRIEQALAGDPPHTLLPPSIDAELNALEKFLRYKVDRLRQTSSILEPMERLDPIAAFQRREADPRGDAFAPLRAERDVQALATALSALVREAIGDAPAARARTFDAALDFLPQLTEPDAVAIARDVLEHLSDVPSLLRAQLLEEVLAIAGHFGDAALSRAAQGALLPLVATAEQSVAADLAPLLRGTVRALRRVGLRAEAVAILEAVAARSGGDALPQLVAQAEVAGGLAALDREDEARPLFERALGRLAADLSVPDRLVLTRAVARGVATCEHAFALAVLRRLERQLPKITDSYNTNSHFCLSVVAFVEALVLGYASDDLVLGDAARRFFDEDEHLVRRRIHEEARG